MRMKAGERGVRMAVLKFLEENVGASVKISTLAGKIGIKQNSVYAVISKLRKAGLLPKAERVQPIPPDFSTKKALEELRALDRMSARARCRRGSGRRRRGVRAHIDVNELKRMRDEGLKNGEIAEKLGVSIGAVYYWVRKLNLKSKRTQQGE